MVTALGCANSASVAGPPSPLNPLLPVPAKGEVTPFVSIFITLLPMFVAQNKLPFLSNAS